MLVSCDEEIKLAHGCSHATCGTDVSRAADDAQPPQCLILGWGYESWDAIKIKGIRLDDTFQEWVKVVDVCPGITQEMDSLVEEDALQSIAEGAH